MNKQESARQRQARIEGLPPEVQQAVARYIQGLSTPVPMSSSDRVEMVVGPSGKATSYSTAIAPSQQMANVFSSNVSVREMPVVNGDRGGIQMSRTMVLPSPMATLPMNSPTPRQYLGDAYENAVYIPHYSS